MNASSKQGWNASDIFLIAIRNVSGLSLVMKATTLTCKRLDGVDNT